MKTIYYTEYGGIDWHDCCETSDFLKENNQYDIKNEDLAIATHLFDLMSGLKESTSQHGKIISEVKLCLQQFTSVEAVLKAIQNNEKISLYSPKDEDGYCCIDFFYNPEPKTVSYSFAYGQVSYNGRYLSVDIPDEDVVYIVTENFLAPTKGIPSVSRFYHEPYNIQEEAEKALQEIKLHDNYRSKKELIILNKNNLLDNEWFALNMKAIELVQKNNLNWYDENFVVFTKAHIEKLETNC